MKDLMAMVNKFDADKTFKKKQEAVDFLFDTIDGEDVPDSGGDES